LKLITIISRERSRVSLLNSAEASEIATAAFIDKRSMIGDNCIIKPGAKIVNSVLGNGVTVEEKAVIENSVIWPHARISAYAELSER
jgi:ADP-glucose pyrophosphorylase